MAEDDCCDSLSSEDDFNGQTVKRPQRDDCFFSKAIRFPYDFPVDVPEPGSLSGVTIQSAGTDRFFPHGRAGPFLSGGRESVLSETGRGGPGTVVWDPLQGTAGQQKTRTPLLASGSSAEKEDQMKRSFLPCLT